MSEARWDVLGFGAVAVDDLVYVDGYPAPDTKMQVAKEARQGGGLTGTALVAVARLGGRAAYCGVLGHDDLSQYTVTELEREGIDCGAVTRREGARPTHATVIVDRTTGQRCILFSREGVMPPSPEDLPEELIAACRVLFIDSSTVASALHAIALARRHGIPSVADIEHATAERVRELIEAVDHLIVGIELAGRVTGCQEPEEMVRALARPDRPATVVTGGDRGCWYAEGIGPIRHVPAFKVAVVDTTGCGDVFHGAYAACIARGEPVPQAIRVAAAAAALKATVPPAAAPASPPARRWTPFWPLSRRARPWPRRRRDPRPNAPSARATGCSRGHRAAAEHRPLAMAAGASAVTQGAAVRADQAAAGNDDRGWGGGHGRLLVLECDY